MYIVKNKIKEYNPLRLYSVVGDGFYVCKKVVINQLGISSRSLDSKGNEVSRLLPSYIN